MVIFDLEDLAASARAGRGARRTGGLADRPARHLRRPPASRGSARCDRLDRPLGTRTAPGAGEGPSGPVRPAQARARAPGGDHRSGGDPAPVARRWARVLGVDVSEEQEPLLRLDEGEVRFRAAAGEADEGLSQIDLEIAPGTRAACDAIDVGGVRVRLLERACAGQRREAGVAALEEASTPSGKSGLRTTPASARQRSPWPPMPRSRSA